MSEKKPKPDDRHRSGPVLIRDIIPEVVANIRARTLRHKLQEQARNDLLRHVPILKPEDLTPN